MSKNSGDFYDSTNPNNQSNFNQGSQFGNQYDKPFVDPYDQRKSQNNNYDPSSPYSPQYNQPINFQSPYAENFQKTQAQNAQQPSIDQSYDNLMNSQAQKNTPQPQQQQIGYENLTSSPYSKFMPNQRLSPEEKQGYITDYLQKYYRSFLNEQEQQRYIQLRQFNSAASGAFAILLPFTVMYSISTKYNPDSFYPKSLQCIIMMGLLGMGMHHLHQKQKTYHQGLTLKYFSQYSDDQIKNFDLLMQQQQRQMQQYEEQQQQKAQQAMTQTLEKYQMGQDLNNQNLNQNIDNSTGYSGYPGFQGPEDNQKKL
ncbi:UNKNOWN [Stylonychia lemnae]|uniref:Uncharacterized protein n=1 Tax=Stylonychia lemnae TaxID=5949 RepID=A0A078ATQ3_STYLE|nr:UNKNOWN [Stylonychia lemnae]|eukprot:CDW84223.1 UNKNOWN [Stylonychia lemnae]